jgi:hypothetical protein
MIACVQWPMAFMVVGGLAVLLIGFPLALAVLERGDEENGSDRRD